MFATYGRICWIHVFATYGRICWIHEHHDPRSKVAAQEAAHIFKRSRLGFALAYKSVRLGRPLCIPCHRIQEKGLDPYYQFPLSDRIDATLAHNEFTRGQPWQVPTE